MCKSGKNVYRASPLEHALAALCTPYALTETLNVNQVINRRLKNVLRVLWDISKRLLETINVRHVPIMPNALHFPILLVLMGMLKTSAVVYSKFHQRIHFM
jgi:hypothetical protein